MKKTKIEKALTEFTKEITDHYTIVVQDESGRRRFTFKDHRVKTLEKELKKRYGDMIVSKIVNRVKKAETEGTLKQFAVDDSVDFVVTGDRVSAVFNESYDDTLNELQAEFVGEGIPFSKIFDEKGRQIPKEKLQGSEWLKTLNQIVSAIKKQGLKDKFAPDKGAIDIQPASKGYISLNADDGSRYVYRLSTGKIEPVAK